MRQFLGRVAAAVRRLMSGVVRIALVSVAAAGGVVRWVWQAMGSGVTDAVDYATDVEMPNVQAPATDADLDTRMHREAGEMAIVAAVSLVRGEGVPAGVDPVIGRWVGGLSRDELHVVARAEPISVGRHMAGLDVLVTVEGQPLRRPEPEADLEREVIRKRQTAERRRVAERDAAATARRERTEGMEWEAALIAPAPVLTL